MMIKPMLKRNIVPQPRVYDSRNSDVQGTTTKKDIWIEKLF